MTARDPRVRPALRRQSRADAWAPEVCPHSEHGVREQDVATRLRRRDRLGWIAVLTTHTPTPGALTIQRP